MTNKRNKNKGKANKGKQAVKKQVQVIVRNKPAAKPVKRITKMGRALRTGGGIIGGLFGQEKLGTMLGSGISRIFGQGDYQIRSNSLMNGGPPAFASLDSGIRIAHREFIQDITSSTSFANTTFQISPSNATMFPWLSSIAKNFEEYTIKGLIFYFNTTCGSAISSTNNSLGTAGMVTSYEPSAPAFGSKRQCEDYAGCAAGVPSTSIVHAVECKPKANVLDRLYVQVNPIVNVEDWKFYSHGLLNVFTQGMQQAGITIGELWVSYDIEFYNPKILPVGTTGLAGSTMIINSTTQAVDRIFGTSDIPQTFGDLGISYQGSTGRILLPTGSSTGYYLLTFQGTRSNIGQAIAVSSVSANVTGVNVFAGGTTYSSFAPNASAANAWWGGEVVFYKSDLNAAYIAFSTGTNISTTMQVTLSVVKCSPSTFGVVSGPLAMSAVDKEQELYERLIKQFKQQMSSFIVKEPELMKGESLDIVSESE